MNVPIFCFFFCKKKAAHSCQFIWQLSKLTSREAQQQARGGNNGEAPPPLKPMPRSGSIMINNNLHGRKGAIILDIKISYHAMTSYRSLSPFLPPLSLSVCLSDGFSLFPSSLLCPTPPPPSLSRHTHTASTASEQKNSHSATTTTVTILLQYYVFLYLPVVPVTLRSRSTLLYCSNCRTDGSQKWAGS